MTETRTAYFELPQYSSGLDGTLTRLDSNEAFGRIEARAAYDDGAQGAALPSANLKPGRYAKQTVTDGYQIHRRSDSGGWDQVGGNVWTSRVRYRSASATDVVLSSDVGGVTAGATLKAGGELATPGIVRSSAVLAAGADLTADLSVPATTGRAYVRTRASGERGLVIEAHDNAAGPLLSLREAGGTYPTTIDSRARLRSTVPAALGAAALTDNLPLGVAAGAADISALDLYGRGGGTPAPALRAYGAPGDPSPLLSVLPSALALGRAGWAGALAVNAAAIGLTGAVTITGGLTVSDDIALADDLIVGDSITAEGGKVVTYDSGSNFGIASEIMLNGGAIATREGRQPLTWRKRILNIDKTVSSTSAIDIHTFDFTPRTTCNVVLNLATQWKVFDPGAAATDSEPNTVLFRLRILSADGASVLFTGDEVYELTLDAYDPHNYVGRGQITVADCPPMVLNAGTTYKIQLWGRRDPATSISLVLRHIIGTIQEGAMIG